MNKTDSYQAPIKENLTMAVSLAIVIATNIMLCVICICCYKSCVSSLDEDCDLEDPSWSTEVRNHNRKIRIRPIDRRLRSQNVKKSRARTQSTFVIAEL